jgi:valyl-tRNA synthetase
MKIFVSLSRFVNSKEMAQRAVRAVQEGQLKIDPDVFEKTWYSWLHDVR